MRTFVQRRGLLPFAGPMVLAFVIGSCAEAADGPMSADRPAADGVSTDDASNGELPDASVGNLSGSLANAQDRSAERALLSARRDLRAGRIAAGLRRLQQLFDREGDSLVLAAGVSRNAEDAATLVLRNGPAEWRETYERLFGRLAESDLRQALQADDSEAVRRVARRFRHTAAGRAAALHLTALAIDRGDADAALRWWREDGEPGARIRGPNSAEPFAAMVSRLGQESAPTALGTGAEGVSRAPESLMRVRWQADVRIGPDAHREIAASLSELDVQGILPLMSARPVVHEGIAYARQLGRIVAIDVATGARLWERPVSTHVSNLIGEQRSFDNAMRRSSSTALFLERLVRSSLTDLLSTDGTRVFAVIPAASPAENMLVALSAEDGRLLWTAGAEVRLPQRPVLSVRERSKDSETNRVKSASDPELKDVFFMGPPQPFGHWRLVVGQKAGTVSLFAIDAADGLFGWSVPLGRALRALEGDKPRHGTACPVTLDGGRAYCPTAAGCLACVDLRTQRLLWAHRYPRDDLPRAARTEDRMRPDTTHATHMPTRERWHEVFLHVSRGRVIFASPDSDRLFAFDARTGRLLWTHDRDRGLFAAGLDDEQVLVVGANRATARAADDGRVVWTANIERPAGTGLLTATGYVFPTESGGLQHVRTDDGRTVLAEPKRDGSPHVVLRGRKFPIVRGLPPKLRPVTMHNLVVAGDAVVLQSFDRLVAIGGTGDGTDTGRDRQPERALATTANDTETGNDGETTDPRYAAWWALTAKAQRFADRQRVIQIASLVRPSLGAAESLFGTARRLTRLMRPSDQRAAALITQLAEALLADEPGGESAETERQAARALVKSTWQRLKQQPTDRLFVTIDDPWRSVRLDHWLERSFAEAVSDDPKIRQPFVSMLTENKTGLDHASDSDGAADGTVGDGTVGDGPAPRGQLAAGAPIWPEGPPAVSEHVARGGNLYVVNVPLTVTADSPWEHVTVQVDRQEQNLWFQRADLAEPVTMTLPRSRDGGQLQGKLLHAWASGPLLCLRVGTDLCGFWLPDAGGPLPTSPLWPAKGETNSLVGKRPPYAVALTEANETPRPLWDDSIPRLADKFSRPVGVVGPVRLTYLCYQQRGNLVALDPMTGREIWCRSGLPLGTYCVGDDDHIVLLRDDSPSVLVLRSLDGATAAEWDWHDKLPAREQPLALSSRTPSSHAVFSQAVFSHIVAVRGTLAVWHSHPPRPPGDEPRLQDGAVPEQAAATMVDLSNGRVLWSQSVRPDSWVFAIDVSQLGNLAADGAFTLWDWESGSEVATHRVSVPNEITNLFVLTDAETAFVVASGRLDDRRLLGANQIRGGVRRPSVNGWMHAIGRSTGRHIWQHELANVGLILDQPRHVPLLVTSYMIQDPERDTAAGVLQCFDRRTGELLYEQLRNQRVYIYHAVRSDMQRSRAEVETSQQIIRFQYGSAD